ncbi:MAG: hypothetical protein DMG74_18315 [Acidobacteria bacterium]|nr:MAG: hypothetical protein DMG74_18315 [Acidobacteriota bacterium]
MGGCQHIALPCTWNKARPKPKLRDRKSLNFQDTIGRPQEIEVEEVETVETVEATGGTARTQRQRFLYRQEKADINRGLMLKVPRSDKSRRVRRTILKAW